MKNVTKYSKTTDHCVFKDIKLVYDVIFPFVVFLLDLKLFLDNSLDLKKTH